MALHLDPIPHPRAYDTVVFAGKLKTPGRCRVTGFNRENEYDHKKGKGVGGSTSTLKGQPPAKGKIEFWTWTEAQRQAWTPILDRLAYKPHAAGTSPGSAAAPTTATAKTPGELLAATQAVVNKSIAEAQAKAGEDVTVDVPEPGSPSTGKSAAKDDGSVTLSKADAIDVFYPTLADVGIHYFLPPEKLGIWEVEGDDFSYMKRTIEFVEFKPDDGKNIATTPNGSDDGSDSADDGTPATNGVTPGTAPAAAAGAAGAGNDAAAAWGGA